LRRLAPIAALALVAGAVAAQAAGGGAAKPAPLPPPAATAPAAPPAVPAVPAPYGRGGLPYAPIFPGEPPVVVMQLSAPALPIEACRPRKPTAARTPPSDALKSAFGILRRERTDEDALPAKALAALKAQRLEPPSIRSPRACCAPTAPRAPGSCPCRTSMRRARSAAPATAHRARALRSSRSAARLPVAAERCASCNAA
jgi:hypothetical protein